MIEAERKLRNRASMAAGILAVIVLMPCVGALAEAAAGGESSAETSARGVLERLIGPRAEDFVLKEIAKENGRDVFEIHAKVRILVHTVFHQCGQHCRGHRRRMPTTGVEVLP